MEVTGVGASTDGQTTADAVAWPTSIDYGSFHAGKILHAETPIQFRAHRLVLHWKQG